MDKKIHVCTDCYKSFKTNHELVRHRNKKFKCTFKEEYLCDIDDKSVLINVIKHQHIENNKLKHELKIKDDMIKLNKQPKNANVHNTQNKTTNNTNNGNIHNGDNNDNSTNIQIVLPHGKENTDYITEEQFIRSFKKCMKSVVHIVGLKHFCKEHPENHNIKITNMRDKYAQIYDGDKWILEDEDDLLQQLYDDNADFLINAYTEMSKENKIDNLGKVKFERFMKVKDDEETISGSKKDFKKMMYNNRDMCK